MQIADLDKDLAAILSNKEKVLAALNQLVGQESYVRAAIAKMKADAAEIDKIFEEASKGSPEKEPDGDCFNNEPEA